MFLQSSPVKLLAVRWRLIVFVGIVVAAAVVLVLWLLSLVKLMPLEYRADAQVLIISQSRYGVDPYTAAKSAERVGENLTQVIKTNDFYQKVVAQSSGLDLTKFNKLNERERRDLWQKTVSANVVYGTGVLNISAFNQDPEQAKQWASAAAGALASKGWEYVGGDVIIKVVNEPLVTKFPVRPNLVLYAFLGFVIGALISMGLVLRKNKTIV